MAMTSDTMHVSGAAPREGTQAAERDVPAGYKQTAVGLIPGDWGLAPCDALCLKIQDGTHFSPKPGGADRLYVTSRNIGRGILDVSDAEYISEAEHRQIYSRCDTRHGDLLLTKDGANTGNAAINTVGEEISLLSSVAFLRFDPRRCTTDFFLQWILSGEGQSQIKNLMSGNAITRLTLAKIKRLSVPVPPLPEQRAIAEALSDVDGLLGALAALIAKKRAIKQAAMQQLLTGKTRLPGFRGEWQTKQFGRCGSTYGGITGKGKADFGHGAARYVTFLNVLENATVKPALFEAVEIGSSETQNRVRRGDVLFNGTSETPEDVALGACVLDDWDDLYLNSFCFGFRFHSDADHDPLFFAYFFRGPMGRQLMSALAQGATRYNMSKRQFLRLECPLPSGDEQRAIARALSDMDAGIAGLEARRDKTRAIKQGMMQQLLSGRVRLVQTKELSGSESSIHAGRRAAGETS